jgi:hypothetical protein
MVSLTDEIRICWNWDSQPQMLKKDRQASLNSKEKTSPANYEPSSQLSSHTKMNNKILKAANVLVPPSKTFLSSKESRYQKLPIGDTEYEIETVQKRAHYVKRLNSSTTFSLP